MDATGGESEYLHGKKIAAWQLEEREAAVCPEDLGFEEYIKILERKLEESESLKAGSYGAGG